MRKIDILYWASSRSVFLKLLLVIIVAAALVNVVVLFYFKQISENPKNNYNKLLDRWSTHLLESFGDPPSFEKAKQLADKLELKIRYEDKSQTWSTADDLPDLEKIRYQSINTGLGLRYGTYEKRHYLILKRAGGTFMVTASFIEESTESENIGLVLIVFLSVIFIAVYFAIRQILRPIQYLKEGVDKAGEGTFDQIIHVKKQDELGQLSRAFNFMTQKIRESFYSKEQLLLNVSHELRSPLTRIKVAAEFLSEGKSKEMVKDEADIMEKMLSELLESARLDSGFGNLELSQTDLSALITEVSESLDNQLQRIDTVLPNSPLVMLIDADRIRTVMRNLLDNAIKNSAKSSQTVRVILDETADLVYIRVRDSGEGIPVEDLPFVFEPFYRGDKSRSKRSGGFGLGLNICKKIVEAHEGTIEMKRRPKQGMEVEVILPKRNPIFTGESILVR